VGETLKFLRTQYRYVIADLGRGLNPFTYQLIEEIDRLFVVATPDAIALRQAARITESFTATGRLSSIQLMLNRFPQTPGLSEEQAATLSGLPVFCQISNAYNELSDAWMNGKLVPARTQIGKDFTRAAESIAHIAPRKEPQRSGSWLQTGWLRAAGLTRG
jgi:pilus assembly protein CpaE